jgi:hypothetical protein
MTNSHATRRILLGTLSAAGATLFAFFFALTFHTSGWVETRAFDFIKREASEKIDATVDSLPPPPDSGALAGIAGALLKKNEETTAAHQESLRRLAHEQMADAIAQIRNLDKAGRAKWAERLKQGSINHIQRLEQANAAITEFIQSTYLRVVADLKRDIRIFTGANAATFLLILAVLIGKPRAILQLFIPGLLATAATLICSYFYLFEQNWLLTIIYNDYLGYAYLGYLGVVFLLLCDIVLNRARVTTEIVNAFLNAIGSALSAVPS